VTVERTVAGKDLVAVHWKAVGTNTVVAGGMPGNGARIGIEGMTFFALVRTDLGSVDGRRYRHAQKAVE